MSVVKVKKSKKHILRTFLNHFFLLLLSFVMVYPILWWFFASFKTTAEMSSRDLLPKVWTLSNYIDGWRVTEKLTFGNFFANSILVSGICVVGAVLSAGLVAYGFGRLKFKGKGIWFSILLMTLMLPSQVTVISQYIMYNKLKMIDTYFPLVLGYCLGGGAFFIFLLVQFVRGIPKELDEAANIDGAGTWGIYWRIIFPLMKPSFVTVAIYAFIWSLDDFYSQMLYLNSSSKYTVSLGLRMFIDQAEIRWGQLLAMALLSIVPSLILFFVNQKEFVEGVATTGLKG